MIEFSVRVDFGSVLAVLFGLLLFGATYNHLVAWLERKGYHEGFLSLVVALGVFGTLVGIAVLSWQTALLSLGGFVFTGTPMILGSIARYIQQREAAKRAIKEISFENVSRSNQ
jgi:ACR3 family arsenite efflux pump ArsB